MRLPTLLRAALPASLPASLLASLLALACGPSGDAAKGADTAAATPPATAASAAAPVPTLVVGGRYETQAGSVVCPRPEAVDSLVVVAQGGDPAALTAAIERAGCSPVVAGAIVNVAEQRAAVARVRRSGDTTTYWMLADKLTPR
jgi:hypothetical protein